jgi:DNA transformation protein
MAKDKSFHDYIVHDLLGNIRGITSRAMFGGWAVYQNGLIFGIIVEGELYFKVDDGNRREFEAMESHPFVYEKKDGKQITMSYWLVPEEIMEDRERFYEFVEKSAAISRKKKP